MFSEDNELHNQHAADNPLEVDNLNQIERPLADIGPAILTTSGIVILLHLHSVTDFGNLILRLIFKIRCCGRVCSLVVV